MVPDKLAELWVVDPERSKSCDYELPSFSCRRSWLVYSNSTATKITSASSQNDPHQVVWNGNPTKLCPNCHHVIDNSYEVDDWPGLPQGVKFDPSDPEIICHLLAKSGLLGLSSHPFINEFITTVNQDDGICYAHPKNLPV
uniref:NAC domain-containing protein n=1 Tax=Brassica oleracea TaxID=3712 RepID=A0A3P6FN24_BRAOL|nr:unnamed protein product [Brassica oleracea]